MITSLRMLFTRWTPWEQSIQAAILLASPTPIQKILATQFDSINKIQRIVQWSEIDFYVMHDGEVNWSDIPTFTNKDDFLLAKGGYGNTSKGNSYVYPLHERAHFLIRE